MVYKKFVLTWIISVSIACAFFVLSVVIIDPIGIFETPLISGVNDYKPKQGAYLDTFKPYQLAYYEPDVIFIGTSRVYVGWYPSHEGFDEKKVYNLGGSSLSLKDIERYLHAAYKIHAPKKVYLGLDFFQFGTFGDKERPGFELERLNRASGNFVWREFGKFVDSVKLGKDIMKTTYEESRKNQGKGKYPLFVRGWDSKRGSARLNRKEYERVLKSYEGTYKQHKFSPHSLEYLRKIAAEARAHNVELYVFFNPISVDLHKLLLSFGHGKELTHVKQEAANIFGEVYDFNFFNPYLSREDLFYDSSHCNMYFAELMKKAIREKKETEFMRVIRKK